MSAGVFFHPTFRQLYGKRQGMERDSKGRKSLRERAGEMGRRVTREEQKKRGGEITFCIWRGENEGNVIEVFLPWLHVLA